MAGDLGGSYASIKCVTRASTAVAAPSPPRSPRRSSNKLLNAALSPTNSDEARHAAVPRSPWAAPVVSSKSSTTSRSAAGSKTSGDWGCGREFSAVAAEEPEGVSPIAEDDAIVAGGAKGVAAVEEVACWAAAEEAVASAAASGKLKCWRKSSSCARKASYSRPSWLLALLLRSSQSPRERTCLLPPSGEGGEGRLKAEEEEASPPSAAVEGDRAATGLAQKIGDNGEAVPAMDGDKQKPPLTNPSAATAGRAWEDAGGGAGGERLLAESLLKATPLSLPGCLAGQTAGDSGEGEEGVGSRPFDALRVAQREDAPPLESSAVEEEAGRERGFEGDKTQSRGRESSFRHSASQGVEGGETSSLAEVTGEPKR